MTTPSARPTDQYDVFLSYARADDDPDYDDAAKSFMRRLYNALTAEGFDVWWDRVSLPSRGERFTREIETAIRQCERFVLIVAPGALASDYVRAEWTFALSECKPITPVLRAGDYDLVPTDLGISEVNAIDARPTRAEAAALADIAARLRQDAPLGGLVGVKPLPDGHIQRVDAYSKALQALRDDAIQSTVISAPARAEATTPTRPVSQQRAVAVYGMGGVGKSTLAAALAHDCQVRRHYRDGVIWIEVGQTPLSIAGLQASIGVHFGDVRDNYPDEREGALSLSRLLRDKTALIVLDDVWDHQLVGRFPVTGTACRLLITTRSGALAGHVQGADIKLSTLTPDEGAALIAARTGADPADPASRAISLQLGGHTLAVTLAAAQIAEGYADSPADMLRLLHKRAESGEPFKDLAVEDADKDLNLALSLAQSYEALGGKNDDLKADLQRRFRATGIFALEGSFDLAALAAVWGEADPDDARAPLLKLVGAGLLDEAEGAGRYSQHRVLRAYARALLRRENELEAAFARYADDVIGASAAFDELPLERWGELEPLLPHVTEVGDGLAARWADAAARDDALTRRVGAFAYNITNYVFRRPQMIETAHGREARGLRWLEMGLKVSQLQDDPRRTALFCNQIGLAWDALGEKRKALDFYEQALPLRRAVGDRGGEATTLNNIGGAWDALGEKRKALDFYEQALPLRSAVGDRGGEATTLNNIGGAWDALGEKRKALDFYEQALPLQRAVGDRGGEATTLNNIGGAWSALGEKRKALDFYEQALPLQRAVGDRGGEATTLNNIGGAWSALGEKRKALDFYEQALPLRRAVGDRGGEATTLNNIGLAWSALGEKRKALDFYEQALPLQRAVGDRGGEATTLNNIGGAWSALGEKRKALDFYEQALPLQRAVGDRGGEAATLNNIGAAYRSLGESRKALDFFDSALPLYRAVGDRGGEATTLNNIGAVYAALGEMSKALDFYEQALEILRQIGDRKNEAGALNNIGGTYRSLGEMRKALDFYESALPLSRAVGDRRGEAATLNNMAGIHFQDGDVEQAAAIFEQIIPVVREIGDVASKAAILLNLAVVYQRLGRIDAAIESAEAGRALMIHYNLPQSASGGTLAQYDAFLAELRGESPHPPTPSPDRASGTGRGGETPDDSAADSPLPAQRSGEGGDQQSQGVRAADEAAQALAQQIMAAYQSGGLDGVRALLAGMGASEEQIAGVLAQLAALGGGDEDGAG